MLVKLHLVRLGVAVERDGWKVRHSAGAAGQNRSLQSCENVRLVTSTAAGSKSSCDVSTEFGCSTTFASAQSDGDCDNGVLASGIAGAFNTPATACKAWSNAVGNVLPRFSARRSIPAHAFGLKKYWGSISPVSKICESEHATAPLRHSEPLRVES